MISRFSDAAGRRRAIEVITASRLLMGHEDCSRILYDEGELLEIRKDDVLIEEGSFGQEMYIILVGQFDVRVRGRTVARVREYDHVGEVAVVDPTRARTASVVAIADGCVLRIHESLFTRLCEKKPILWRRMAVAFAERLDERGNSICARNEIPRLFIGSSTECLLCARAIQKALAHDDLIANVWPDDVFKPSSYPLIDLIEESRKADFAALLFGNEDVVISRKVELESPRDNIIYEHGLFVGSLGIDRVFVILDANTQTKIPTDLLGVTPIIYRRKSDESLDIVVQPAVTQLRETIRRIGPK